MLWDGGWSHTVGRGYPTDRVWPKHDPVASDPGHAATSQPGGMGGGVQKISAVPRVQIVRRNAPCLLTCSSVSVLLISLFTIHPCSVHHDLTLEGFKRIFYMEYAHRMWGRATGLLFFIPPVYFWAKGWVGHSLKPRLFIYAGLVVFQVQRIE